MTIINKLQTSQHQCYFISPNLEEVVLSSGKLLRSLRDSKVDVTCVSVYSAPVSNQSVLRILKQLGIRSKYLGYDDVHSSNSLIKRSAVENNIQLLGKYLLNLYLQSKHAYFFVPLGLGGAVCHWEVREAALRWLPLDRIIFWQEQSYKSGQNIENSGVIKYPLKKFQRFEKSKSIQSDSVDGDSSSVNTKEGFYIVDFSKLAPRHIGEYSLTKNVDSTPGQGEYQFAIYTTRKGAQAYVKILPSYATRLARKWFENEVSAYRYINITNTKLHVNVPRLIKTGEHLGHRYLMLEKVRGKHLLDMSTSIKINSYRSIINFLSKLQPKKAIGIVRRGPLYWLAILPIIVAKALLHKPSHRKVIVSAFMRVLRSSVTMITRSERSIVHRDLNYDNVILNDGKISLIDFQLACIADPMLEYAVLYLKLFHDQDFIRQYHNIIYKADISGNYRREITYRCYLIIICLYELALHSQNPDLAIKCLENIRRNK